MCDIQPLGARRGGILPVYARPSENSLVELPEKAQVRFRARYSETDQMGIVYHANYLAWFEMARTELCAVRGVRYRDIEEQDHLLLTVVEAHCRYVAPARYDDEVIAEARLAFSHSRMIGFAYEIRNAATSQLLVSGETKHVFITPDGRPARVPRKYFDLFGIPAPIGVPADD
jgi:acyl-CoA thioester hydrolase